MTTDDAHALARRLTRQHGLSPEFPIVFSDEIGWRLGSCVFAGHRPVEIVLVRRWVEILDEAQVQDTILHEIAHALVGAHAQHGPSWKAMAERIGAQPKEKATFDLAVIRRFQERHAKYLIRCPCEQVFAYRFRQHRSWRETEFCCPRCRGKLTITTLR
jgi:predicted SprT family Zn-dependent metalloprotease